MDNSLSNQKDYWNNKLSGELPVLQIPTDYPRPPVQSFMIEEESIRLDESTLENLIMLSEKEEISLFTLLLSLYKATLMRYTGLKDIIIGSPCYETKKNGSLEEKEVNIVALRTDISNNLDFSGLFKLVSKTVYDAKLNVDYPFAEILNSKNDIRNRAPIFQTMFALLNTPNSLSEETLTEDKILEIEEFSIRCDTLLTISLEPEHLSIRYRYDSDLYSQSSAKQFLSHYKKVIEKALENPQSNISDFSLLSDIELDLITNQWNATGKNYNSEHTIQGLFEKQAKLTPDSIAISFDKEQISYKALNNISNQVANYLITLGVKPEVKVGVGLKNSIELIISILGILKSGGVYVPLDINYPEKRLDYMISQSEISLIITDDKLVNKIPANKKIKYINLDNESEIIESCSKSSPNIKVHPDNLAYIIFTSGSTGEPKGVSIPHKGISNRLSWGRELNNIGYEDRFLQSSSISFDASLWQIFGPLVSGACLILADSDNYQDPQYLAQTISQENVTIADFVPTMLGLIVNESDGLDNTLRCVTCGGESLHLSVRDSFFSHFSSSDLFNCYGPTETSIDATYWACDKNSSNISIGRPIANAGAYILDDNLQAVPIGVTGELYIKGTGLAEGYINNPYLSAQSFIPNPYSDISGERIYKTGDLARFSSNGNIEFLGRSDNQVNLNGYRIELDEIKNVLRKHPDISDCIVLAQDIKSKHLEDSSNDISAIKETEVDDINKLLKELESIDRSIAEELLSDVENMSESEAQKVYEELSGIKSEGGITLKRKTSDFEITLDIKSPEFISPPQENQRNWTLQRTVDEFVDDLKNLDMVTKRFVKGSQRTQIEEDWDKSKAEFDDSQLIIEGQQVMQDWERPLMKAMAEIVTEKHGDVLEVGFGMGISSTYIQNMGVNSHTVIECNTEVAEKFNKWKEQYPGKDIKLIFGEWQDITDQLESYDGVFFDTYPLSEEEFIEYAIKDITFAEHFFSTAAKHLKDGGIFTYYTNEIDSFSRRHQRLLLKYFKSYTLSKVMPLYPPEDCNYWWADSMMTVKAEK